MKGKILFWSICVLVGSVGTVTAMSFFAQQGSTQKLLVADPQPSQTPVQQASTVPNTQTTNTTVITAEPTPQTAQTPETQYQQPPTVTQQPNPTQSPAESYRQSTNSCPGRPLRIRDWEDYALTAESNVGAVRPCDYVLVGGSKVSVKSFGCNGDQPLEFVKVTVPPEIEVLDPKFDDDPNQRNDVEPQRDGYAAICGLNLGG